jgi:uncharacterized protein (TIGR02996 family)
MSEGFLASRVAAQLGAVLDDNVHVPVVRVLEFERALADNPTDLDTRRVYRDWLLEHGCGRRAAQVERDLADRGVPPPYTGTARPERVNNWAGL